MLPRELIKKIRKIEIATNRLVDDVMAGQYHSVFKGRGMAFDEVRLYQPGDDIRVIDWNVSARLNDIFVKQFVEERELTVMLAVDASASGAFGTRSGLKAELAAEVAALLAFSAIENDDRVGLFVFTDAIERFVPPKKGRKHVLALIAEILNFRPRGRGTDLRAGLEFLSQVAKRSSVAFLISDFQDDMERYRRALRVAHRKHDLISVVIADPLEEELPAAGVVFFRDPETGEVLPVDTSSRRVREAYARAARLERERREALFRRHKIDWVDLRTDRDFVRPLVDFFRVRARRR